MDIPGIGPIFGSVVFFLVSLAVISGTGAFLVHKFIPHHHRVSNRMLMQPALTVAGMLFSILLGFFIAQSLKDYGTANTNLINEANYVGEVFRDARGLNEVDRVRIRKLCRQYVDSVINDEWKLLEESQASPKTQALMNDLWEATLSAQPTCAREQIIYDSLFRGMNDLGGARRLRVGTVNNAGIPMHLWAIISFGAGAIVTLTFIFAPDNKFFHTALLACLIVPMTLNIYLLAEYAYPFSGINTIKPVMFKSLQQNILVTPDTQPKYLESVCTRKDSVVP